MSDLQCPATFVVLPPGARGAGDVADGCAVGYAGPAREAELRTLVGADVPVRVETGLCSDDPRRLAAALEELADLHRGERVLVAPDGVPVLCRADAVTVVRIDADGWAVAPS